LEAHLKKLFVVGVVGMKGLNIIRLVTVMTELPWAQILCLQHISHSL